MSTVSDPELGRKAHSAHMAVRYAVLTGKLERGPCAVEGCDADKTVGHHEDYDRPLDVVWLCRLHHAFVHTERRHGGPYDVTLRVGLRTTEVWYA